jgi:hypothetical protein
MCRSTPIPLAPLLLPGVLRAGVDACAGDRSAVSAGRAALIFFSAPWIHRMQGSPPKIPNTHRAVPCRDQRTCRRSELKGGCCHARGMGDGDDRGEALPLRLHSGRGCHLWDALAPSRARLSYEVSVLRLTVCGMGSWQERRSKGDATADLALARPVRQNPTTNGPAPPAWQLGHGCLPLAQRADQRTLTPTLACNGGFPPGWVGCAPHPPIMMTPRSRLSLTLVPSPCQPVAHRSTTSVGGNSLSHSLFTLNHHPLPTFSSFLFLSIQNPLHNGNPHRSAVVSAPARPLVHRKYTNQTRHVIGRAHHSRSPHPGGRQTFPRRAAPPSHAQDHHAETSRTSSRRRPVWPPRPCATSSTAWSRASPTPRRRRCVFLTLAMSHYPCEARWLLGAGVVTGVAPSRTLHVTADVCSGSRHTLKVAMPCQRCARTPRYLGNKPLT